MPPAADLDVSVLLVTWNSGRWIGSCLAALPAACHPLRFEVVIADNASGDDTIEQIERARASGSPGDASLQLLPLARNEGFAGGVNRAREKARGRSLLLLNPDCEMQAGSVATLVAYLDSHPEVVAAAPLLLDSSGEPQREFQLRRFPTPRIVAAELLLWNSLRPRNAIASAYRYRELDITRPQAVEQPAAAALLVRRAAADAAGPLDEQFAPAWFEDVDFCRRLWAGGEIHLVPAAKGVHHGGASLEHVSFEEFAAIWYANLHRYARKWFSRGEAEGTRWLIIAGMLLRAGAGLAGFSGNEKIGRWRAARVYLRVAGQAFHRWDKQSRSS